MGSKSHLRDELESILRDSLIAAAPFLREHSYADLLQRIQSELFHMLDRYVEELQPDSAFGDDNYATAELDLLTGFLDSLPSVKGSLSAEEKDRLDSLLTHGLGIRNINLADRDRAFLVNRFREALKMFGGLLKIDSEYASSV